MKPFFSTKGVVTSGMGRAAKLGFPTVNVPLDNRGITGVYAARIRSNEGEHRAAAFADPKRGILEAHLLDFSGDLYGQTIMIELFEKFREAEFFDDDAILAEAIAEDIASVRRYFAKPQSHA
jgi:riboflavin kinase/FMN adenylyltransferase